MPVSTNVKDFANKLKVFNGHGCVQYNKSIDVDKKNQLDVSFVFFISLLIAAQHVSDNHVPIIRS